ncbi:MAG: ATP-binding protein [Deltaproteobacteria bacterium]|nr:ATP-binding protein [Deltaproteobacteria bacterium]
MDIGTRLKEVRRLKGMSLRDLARRVDVSASFLSQVEKGKCRPSLETLGKISAALDVKVDYFLREEEKKGKEVVEIRLPNQLKYLAVVASLITELSRIHHIGRKDMEDILLAVDEASTNVIKYAYEVGSFESFTIRMIFDPGRVHIELHDHGKPFNPLEAVPPDSGSIVKNRNLGGLGIFLINKVMDRVEYHYSVDGGNCLTLIKNVSDSRRGET